MTLQEYIQANYDGSPSWFRDECMKTWHVNRVHDILDTKEYLAGKHRILTRNNENWNGKAYETRKIILQLPKTLCNFETSFLLKNPVTLVCEEQDTLKALKDVYKRARYDNIDFKLLDKMVKYGEIYEYVYVDDKEKITSRIIPGEDSYPVFDDRGKMICFVEYYVIEGVSYYTVYEESKVKTYTDDGGDLRQIGEYDNLSGLPIQYKTMNEMDSERGRSDIDDYVGIVDSLEDLISKYTDALHKYISGIPVLTGEKLKIGKQGEGQVDPNAVGFVLQIEQGSEFGIVQNKMDSNSFKALYDKLLNNLLLAAQCPSIALNQQELSNISETSIKMTYSLATIKAKQNSECLLDGFEQRWDKIMKLLELQGVKVEGDVDCTFEFDIPENSAQIIEDIDNLREHGLISKETALSRIPYVYDVQSEMEKIKAEEKEKGKETENKDKDKEKGTGKGKEKETEM